MTGTKEAVKRHPREEDLAGWLAGTLSGRDKEVVETHIASCDECLGKAVAAYDSVKEFYKTRLKRKDGFMKRLNMYLVLAVIAFALSFIMPGYFLQMLVATLLLGLKWVVDSKTTKMLVMIHEAWKAGGAKEAGRVVERLDQRSKSRI